MTNLFRTVTNLFRVEPTTENSFGGWSHRVDDHEAVDRLTEALRRGASDDARLAKQ